MQRLRELEETRNAWARAPNELENNAVEMDDQDSESESKECSEDSKSYVCSTGWTEDDSKDEYEEYEKAENPMGL